MAGVASPEFFDATGFFIQRDDGVPIQQRSGEISNSAAHFYDAPADFARYETRLPREIVFRLAHPLLISERVGCCFERVERQGIQGGSPADRYYTPA